MKRKTKDALGERLFPKLQKSLELAGKVSGHTGKRLVEDLNRAQVQITRYFERDDLKFKRMGRMTLLESLGFAKQTNQELADVVSELVDELNE